VANFHLKNGAQIYRINFKGNLSENGWRTSYGMMVNYGYYLDRVDFNCINYLINKQIVVSDLVRNDLSLFKI
jgi:malonyl-CoA decarboxylase